MKKIGFLAYFAAFAALLLAGFFIKSEPAIAQQANEEQTIDVIENVVKVEDQFERHHVRHAPGIAKTEIIKLRRRVSYADLDLSKDADIAELKRRIETTAKEACRELDEMAPLSPSNRIELQRCIKQALASTDDELRVAIEAAG